MAIIAVQVEKIRWGMMRVAGELGADVVMREIIILVKASVLRADQQHNRQM